MDSGNYEYRVVITYVESTVNQFLKNGEWEVVSATAQHFDGKFCFVLRKRI